MSHHPDWEDPELERANEVLARTTEFLELCAEDPDEAFRSENLRELVETLSALSALASGHPVQRDPVSPAPLLRRGLAAG